jgi:hypothetical protein
MLVYAHKITPRLTYVLDYIFSYRLGIDYEYCQDEEQFGMEDKPKLFYAEKNMDSTAKHLFIPAVSFLFSDKLEKIPAETAIYLSFTLAFPTKDNDFSVDPFANIFFLLSRYEEYLSDKRDEHQRFAAEESHAYQNGYLHYAVVDRIILAIKEKLLQKYPKLNFKEEKFEAITSYDIDMAYAYKYKGFFRQIGASVKSLVRRDFPVFKERLKVINNKKKDPFDSFDYIFNQQHKTNTKALFFIHCGRRTKYDKSISVKKKPMQKLLLRIAEHGEVGIHPSYYQMEKTTLLRKEIALLEKYLKQKISKSRFHFLRFRVDTSYQELEKAGIRDDYSMYFASETGFRAGTSRPFLWYDLKKEKTSTLWIHPFCFMDGTLQDYHKLKHLAIKERIALLIKEVRETNGCYISLWHNESLSDQNRWKGWRAIFEFQQQYLSKQ